MYNFCTAHNTAIVTPNELGYVHGVGGTSAGTALLHDQVADLIQKGRNFLWEKEVDMRECELHRHAHTMHIPK